MRGGDAHDGGGDDDDVWFSWIGWWVGVLNCRVSACTVFFLVHSPLLLLASVLDMD